MTSMLPQDFKFDVQACAKLIREPDTLTLPLLAILMEAYGEYLFEMDPVELYLTIEEDFHARLTEEGENRVQAGLMALTSDLFYTDPLVTRSITLAMFEGDLGDMVTGVLEDVEISEVLWAVYEVGLLRDDDEEFSPPVQQYVDSLIKEASVEANVGEGEVVPHYAKILMTQKRELREQMAQLGLEDLELP